LWTVPPGTAKGKHPFDLDTERSFVEHAFDALTPTLSHPLRMMIDMAATFSPSPQPTTTRRPPLRSIEGGRSPAALRRVACYRRRRLMALIALTVLVAVLTLLANAAVAGIVGGGDTAPAADATAPATPVGAVYVVQPGDTLWSIAAEIAPGTDVRRTVDRLVDLNGATALAVGQRLRLS
jgi:hypothetical protein